MPSFKMGLGGPISLKGDQVLNWIHMEDEVGIIEHVLSNSSISGPVNAVAPEIQTNREWAQKFAKGKISQILRFCNSIFSPGSTLPNVCTLMCNGFGVWCRNCKTCQ